MKKFDIAHYSVLVILLLSLIPLTLLFGTESAGGLNFSVQWGHLNPNNYEEDEKELEEEVCDYIYWCFYYDFWGSWGYTNAWWDYTNDTVVGLILGWENDNASFCTNWWVGDYHADPPPHTPLPFGHLWFYGHDDVDINDTNVYDYATSEGTISSKQKFDFIWTCTNGGRYWYNSDGDYYNISGIFYPIPGDPGEEPTSEPTNTNDEYGFFEDDEYAVGMPLAWTGTSNMALDGYNGMGGSYCYIGFEGNSPFMIDDLPESEVPSDYFPRYFYLHALGYYDDEYPYYEHQSIRDSLNFASWNTFGCSFNNSPFYEGYWVYLDETEVPPSAVGWWFCHMRVLGNGYMILPYS